MPEKKEAECCGRTLAHKKDGRPYEHACHREGLRPDDEFEVPGKQRPQAKPGTKGPWFPATYDSECDACDGAVYVGDEIRADGSGGWECRENCDDVDEEVMEGESPRDDGVPMCVLENVAHSYTWNPVAQRSQCVACGESDTAAAKAARVTGASGQYLSDDPPVTVSKELAVPDPWEDAAPAEPIVPEVNVSGQPKARYEWRGSTNLGYLTKDPATGDFKRYKNGKPRGFTRVTTFVKAASDSTALTDWAKRNVLIGASKRPDVVARAHGLTHEDNRGDLMSLVDELETAAGAKVSADIGTMVHEFTERADGDPEFELSSIPPGFRPAVALYRRTIREAGLIPVAGLIERTTHVADFGGVTGTWDRVYYHERSGQYVIGDVKTGKTLEYGMAEIEAQEAIYARGANTSGAYDWNTDTWQPPRSYGDSVETGPWELPPVSEDWGVIVHMPVQGKDAGKCLLVKADLQRGWQWARLCHDVRMSRAAKPKPEAWTGTELDAPVPRGGVAAMVHWDMAFRTVENVAQASTMWEKARAAGITGLELNRLVGLAQQRLRELGISG